jgi:ribosome biogenesis GTPase A
MIEVKTENVWSVLKSKKVDASIVSFIRNAQSNRYRRGKATIIKKVLRNKRDKITPEYVEHRLDYLERVGVIRKAPSRYATGRYANEIYYVLSEANR